MRQRGWLKQSPKWAARAQDARSSAQGTDKPEPLRLHRADQNEIAISVVGVTAKNFSHGGS